LISAAVEHQRSPWRFLSDDWMRFRTSVSARAIEGPEAAACELFALAGPQDVDAQVSRLWKATDLAAAQRIRRLLESLTDSRFQVHKRIEGQSYQHVTYDVGSDATLPAHVDFAIKKEQRRLSAGDRWLLGALEPDQLARALWSAAVLASPPMNSPGASCVVWRVPSRTDALALEAAGRRLGLRLGKLERRFNLWRVSVDQAPPLTLCALERLLP